MNMGEGAYSKPIYFGRYIVFYAILLYYVAFCSVSTIHFLIPFTVRLFHIFWLIFIDKRWNVLAILLCLAAFVRYIFFKSNKEYSAEVEDDLIDLQFQPSSMASELLSYPPLSPPSYCTSPRSSVSSPWSSLQSSPRSTFSSPPPSPPPLKRASNASLSSDESGDSDIDSKADKFIAQFRSRLMLENELETTRMREQTLPSK